MRYLPPRRWLQFRLSTWFALVAILCWAMAEWPWWTEYHVGYWWRNPTATSAAGWEAPTEMFVFDNDSDLEATRKKFVVSGHWSSGSRTKANSRLIYPAIGFLAFLAIKCVMALPALKSPSDSPS